MMIIMIMIVVYAKRPPEGYGDMLSFARKTDSLYIQNRENIST